MSSIVAPWTTQRLQTDLGRSVRVRIATQLLYFSLVFTLQLSYNWFVFGPLHTCLSYVANYVNLKGLTHYQSSISRNSRNVHSLTMEIRGQSSDKVPEQSVYSIYLAATAMLASNTANRCKV